MLVPKALRFQYVKTTIVNTPVRLYVGIARSITFINSTANSEAFTFKVRK
jgi:hypothetical protein